MTQDEFDQMLQNAVSNGFTGYFPMRYGWEEIETLLDWVKQQMES